MRLFVVLILSLFHLAAISAPASPADRAQALQALQQQYQLSDQALAAVEFTDIYRSDHNGVLHAYFRQTINGIPIVNAPASIHIDITGKPISTDSKMIQDVTRMAAARAPLITADNAIQMLAGDRNLDSTNQLQRLDDGIDGTMQFKDEQLSADQIPVKAVYFLLDDELRLAWNIVLRPKQQEAWWNGWVDAQNGEVLAVDNWVDDAAYRVFALPKESPLDGGRTLETDVAVPNASPFGWHDTNGIIGAEFTDTRGNNVFAQSDLDANNAFPGGADPARPDGGSELIFDVPLDLAVQQPPDYLDFAVINLFYWNNILHDLLYQYGFDEVSGNFQENNYGNGGLGSDAVNADAQDGSDTNNANFGTPGDGGNPRMQMFIFTPNDTAALRVNSPGSIAGDYTATPAGFGSPLSAIGLTAELEIVDDGTGTAGSQGCNALTGFTAGAIAVVDRGGCEFGLKGLNAQTAGAAAMIVVNNAPGNATIAMGAGANGGSVTIPAAMISNNSGNIIKPQIPVVNATLLDTGAGTLNRDSDLDAGIIAHEYGHGVSNRLTGGPSQASCLFGSEQQGEGWSDFLDLVFTPDPADTANTPRGVGRWATFRDDDPAGTIRPAPYSRDMTVNPLTYGALRNAGQPGGVSVPHGVGTVWATVLWDMYWNLVDRYGFDEDLYNGTGGNNLAIQLVMDGMKLQPCGPTFVTSRDAILAADNALTGGENQCDIWDAFARRGVGFSASDGGGPTTLNVTEAFDLLPSCETFHMDGFEALP